MKLSFLPLITLASALSMLMSRPVFAAALVRSIPITQAQEGGAHLSVWLGSGTNIDFTRTGEVIQKVWLDDPSRLTVDFDGSLGRASSDSFGGSEGTGASVIHLRRVTGISFPHLPETAATLLTVVTQTSSGGHRLYQFEVTYGSGTPQYATVALMPNATDTGNGTASGLVLANGRSATLADVEHGLQQAVSQNLIAANSPVVARTQDFLARVRNGSAMQLAAAEANISMAVVSQLAMMGMSSLSRSTLLPTGSVDSDLTMPTAAELPATPAAPL